MHPATRRVWLRGKGSPGLLLAHSMLPRQPVSPLAPPSLDPDREPDPCECDRHRPCECHHEREGMLLEGGIPALQLPPRESWSHNHGPPPLSAPPRGLPRDLIDAAAASPPSSARIPSPISDRSPHTPPHSAGGSLSSSPSPSLRPRAVKQEGAKVYNKRRLSMRPADK